MKDVEAFRGCLVGAHIFRSRVFSKTKSTSGQYVPAWFVLVCARCLGVWYAYIPPLKLRTLYEYYGTPKVSTRYKILEIRVKNLGFQLVSYEEDGNYVEGWVCPECFEFVKTLPSVRVWGLQSDGRPTATITKPKEEGYAMG